MNIVVCIKQVPDAAEVRIHPETHTLIREEVRSMINPFDRHAIEEAVLIRERTGGRSVVLSMGPPQAERAVREALSLGVDGAVLLSSPAFAGSDTLITSFALARAVERMGPVDLVLCGKQAVDGDTAQVGPGIAAHLNVPQVAYVRRIVSLEGGRAVVERMTEGGYEVVEAELPALLTLVKEINVPRLPSLTGKLRSLRQEVAVWGPEELQIPEERFGLDASPTWVEKIFPPPIRGEGKVLEGAPDEMAENLLRDLEPLNLV